MVTDIEPTRSVNLKDGSQGEVTTATLHDETGSIKLSLWNEMIEKVTKGVKVNIKNGYVSLFKGEKQLNVGKYGTLELVDA